MERMLRRRDYGYYRPFVCYKGHSDGWYEMVTSAPHLFTLHNERLSCKTRYGCKTLFHSANDLEMPRSTVFHVRFTKLGREWLQVELVKALLCQSH
jgi:hypothetical protein